MDNKKALTNYKIILPLLALLVAAALNFVGSEIISNQFPIRPVPDDLMFLILPRLSWTQVVTDLANIFSFLLILYYLISYATKDTPRYLLSFALAYFLRACMIVLTPLGEINGGDGSFYGVHFVKQLGAFPSGHTIMVCLAYLLIDRKKHLLLSNLALISIIVEVITLLTSRGHYSIDIVGGFLVAFFAYNFLLKYKQGLSLA